MATGTAKAKGQGSAKPTPTPTPAPIRDVTRLRDLKVGVRDLIMLDPHTIKIEKGFNCRDYRLPENHDHLDELKKSIKSKGVQIPLLVRFDAESKQAILVDGECRLRAVLELIREGTEIASVPVAQVPGNNPADRLAISLTANTGKPLSKWESGAGFQRLVNYGWDVDRISEELGFTEKFIREAIELADAPDDVKMLLSERAVTPSLALYHLRRTGSGAGKAVREAADQAKASGKKIAKAPKKVPVQTPVIEPKRVSMAATVTDPDNLADAIRDLLADADLEQSKPDGEYEWMEITVDKIKLAEVARLVGMSGWWDRDRGEGGGVPAAVDGAVITGRRG